MTVQSPTARADYDGNGVTTTPFPVPFRFLRNTDIKVLRTVTATNVSTTLILDSLGPDGFSIVGAGNPSGGTVTVITAPAVGERLSILRNMPFTQRIDYIANDAFPAESHESGLDERVMENQQLLEVVSRAIVLPPQTVGVSNELPGPVALNLLRWKADLTGLENAAPPAIATVADGAVVDATVSPIAGIQSTKISFVQSGSGSVTRLAQDKLRERLTTGDKGIVGDSGLDVTSALNALIVQGGAEGRVVEFGAGVFLVNGLTLQSNVQLVGQGAGRTIIRRLNSAPGNAAIIDGSGISGFSLRGITFDGNSANQINAAHNVVLFGCADYSITGCQFINAKVVSGGFGAGMVIIDGANQSTGSTSYITGNSFTDNGGPGLSVTREWNLIIDGNAATSNGGDGITLANFTYPPADNKQIGCVISNNRSISNGGNGILAQGYVVGGAPGSPIYGPDAATSRCTISGNVCLGNVIYGIAWQGAFGAVTGNVCAGNSGFGASAGIVFNGLASTCVGNSCFANQIYGIDAGGSYQSVISSNQCYGNGSIGINLGASQNCVCDGNQIVLASSGQGAGITMPGIDGDGVTPFPKVGSGTMLSNNSITLNANAASLGVFINRSYQRAVIKNNRVYGALGNFQAYILECDLPIVEGNEDDYAIGTTGSIVPQVVSAGVTVIPDHVFRCQISGTTGITQIRSYSNNVYFEKVRDVVMTNQGSGYTGPFLVTFTGGGGAGALAMAEVDNGGRVIGVSITNPGSGYTSAPTPSFAAGAGTGAAGISITGVNNLDGREILLFFNGALTLTDGTGLDLNGNYSTTANKSTLRLFGVFGGLSELARNTP